MNEILYADCDTDHFKMPSDKVWVLAPQSIDQYSGTVKQTSLPTALRGACRFKHEGLKTKRITIRFVHCRPTAPHMVQTASYSSQPSSLSRALKKAVQIKNGQCSRTIGIKTIEGTTVWSLTPAIPSTTFKKKHSNLNASSFLAALKRVKNTKTTSVDVTEQIAPFEDEQLLSVVASTYHTYQGLAITV